MFLQAVFTYSACANASFDPLVPMITFILFLPTPGFRYQTEINPAIPFYTVPAALWIPSV